MRILITMSNTDNYETIGFRFISPDFSSEPKVGDILENSNIWDGDEPTNDELNGTCAFSTLEECEEYSKYSKGWIVKIGGENAGYGDLAGELLIGNAEVLEVTKWK